METVNIRQQARQTHTRHADLTQALETTGKKIMIISIIIIIVIVKIHRTSTHTNTNTAPPPHSHIVPPKAPNHSHPDH
jgi:hypothetical protein